MKNPTTYKFTHSGALIDIISEGDRITYRYRGGGITHTAERIRELPDGHLQIGRFYAERVSA